MPRLAEGPGHVKGNAIRDFITWYIEEHDQGELLDAIGRLPPRYQSEFDPSHPSLGILPSTWYPAEIVHSVLDDLTANLSRAEMHALARGAGEATVAAMMRGAHRILFRRILTPGAYGRIAALAWKLNYDTGMVRNEVLSPTRHRGVVSDWAGHHPFLCRMNVAAKRAIYEAMKCKHPEIELAYCITDGDETCGSIIRWESTKG